MGGKMITLKNILEVENDEEILRFKCPDTGYLLWPFIRNTFIRFIMSDLLYETPLISEGPSSRPRKAYASVLRACTHNLLKGRHLKGPILISSSGSHVLRDGRYFNRLSDDFALAAKEQTVTLETLFTKDWHWPFPRYNEKVLFDTPLLVCSSLYRRIFAPQKHADIAEALVKFVAQRANRLLDWSLSEERQKRLILGLSKHVASFPAAKRWYAHLFRETGARLLIREEGCYGGSSLINRIARDCNVITAEYQHGAISSGHDAYNFAEVLRSNEEYKKTLPQYFLGYGQWWMDQVGIPSIKIAIGNPNHTESIAKVFPSNQEKKDILVLGDGIETEKYLSLCSFLAQEPKMQRRIVFRPHPLERGRVFTKYGNSFGSVVIEWEKGIYEALQTADMVVSELSTGLFEALGLANRIFLWNTPKAQFCYPSGHPFATFSDAENLLKKILDGESGTVDCLTVEAFWAPHWKENYLAFLQSLCPGILDSREM